LQKNKYLVGDSFKAGFVSILGKPNVGKSTLLNSLIGEKLSITTSRAQTTRQRIMGILNGPGYQVVYSDTPGIIKPAYELQKAMMSLVHKSLEDADLVLYITDQIDKEPDDSENLVLEHIQRENIPLLVVLNKSDLFKKDEILQGISWWKQKLNTEQVIPVSALKSLNTEKIFSEIIKMIPEHPAYFPEDELSDKSERFFAAEIIREKIFLNYRQEVPYSTEVAVVGFKESEEIIRISAEIFVERQSQKGIIIGKKGEMLKKVGIEARKDLEAFFGKQVFLEQFVKVEPDWRKKPAKLSKFGYL
jgi:GTP-binding protein Era